MRAAAIFAILVLLSPMALADAPLTADAVRLAGETSVASDIAALFFVAMEDGITWEATAASGTLVREYSSYRAVENPTNPFDYLWTHAEDMRTETIELYEPALASTSTIEGGAMLVQTRAGIVNAHTSGLVEAKATSDPTVVQDERRNAGNSNGPLGLIFETIPGDFLNLTFSDGSFVLQGDLTLIMYGPAYVLTTDGAATEWQTGQFETANTAVYTEGREERHEITLRDAVLRLRAMEPATIFTTYPTIDIAGTIEAPGANGALDLGGVILAPPAEGGDLVYSGIAKLALSNAAGRVGAATPLLAMGASGAPVTQGPPLLPVAIGLVALCALAGVAALILRARRDRGNDMELALLAMEERRWNDALPHLTRITKKRPDDASAQIDRALCLEQIGRFDEAARAFEAALRHAPKHAEAHFYYARTLAKMREPEAARVHLETALERDPRLVEMARSERVLRGL